MPSVTKMLLGDVPAASRAAMMRPPGSGSPMTATAQQAPTNLIAGLFSFREAAMLESTTSEVERAAPRVNLA